MDVISSAYSLTVGIINFFQEHDSKDATISQIYNTTLTIQQVIRPLLQSKPTDASLHMTISGLHVHLKLINEHLNSWERPSKKVYSFVNPWAVTQELKDDLDQLMRQYILLMGALQTVQYTRSYNVLRPSQSNNGHGESVPSTQSHQLRADLIWKTFLGKELDFCETEYFLTGVSRILGRKLSKLERKRLLLKLGERDMGYVFRGTFNELVGNEEVTEAISYYISDPRLPLLVWVDDDLQNNIRKVSDARKYGVTVVQLTSTVSAKAWMKVNKEFLRKHDNASDIRYITDQVRDEPDESGVTIKNWHGGDQIVEYIRGKMKLKAPILVYTGKGSLTVTRYVESFPNTGSMASHYKVFQTYVFQLGGRKSLTSHLTYNMVSDA